MRILFIAIIVLSLFSCQRSASPEQPQTVREVMDDVITRLYKEVPEARYDSIDDAYMISFLTNEEKQVLATRYLYFSVNVPVTVSLMRHISQATPPFWLEESGFVKTELIVKNVGGNEYEVWEKKFEAGTVELGINGFDKHRPVYFISVGKINPTDDLKITDIYPSQYSLDTMRVGAFTYHDWTSLTLTEVPEKLVGQVLFTTVRGRAREAHVVNGFRKTPFPSSANPDQVMLTYSSSPQTTIDIQWRTDTTVADGVARYWIEGSKDTLVTSASKLIVQDRMLFNDRYIHRHTAALKDLKPGANYGYQVGSKEMQLWSAPNSFKTEAVNTDKFSFVWFGDTHTFPDTTKLVSLAIKNNPDAAFYSIAGDLVSTGLNRDDWDKLFDHGSELFAHKPLMPVLGNHDRQDGMGAQLYYDLFSLPKNGPAKVEPEGSYSFEYGNALYIMIDCTSEVNDHTAWIESVLANTKATWKFVMFHFPPYNFEEPYPDIQQAWGPLFDKYHVDMMMGGHVHYYMRSKPMFAGKVVDSFNKGTVYAISISIPWSHENIGEEPYAVKRYPNGYYYQRMEIDGKVLKYTSVNIKGEVTDEFVIRK